MFRNLADASVVPIVCKPVTVLRAECTEGGPGPHIITVQGAIDVDSLTYRVIDDAGNTADVRSYDTDDDATDFARSQNDIHAGAPANLQLVGQWRTIGPYAVLGSTWIANQTLAWVDAAIPEHVKTP